MGLYYLYHHIRLDTNTVFYVGIGKIYKKPGGFNFISEKSKYSRAFYTRNRSLFWKNIVSKTKYDVKIILESEDINFIKSKEIEHIQFYGRKDLSKGTLVNLTDGGDGIFNCAEETRLKMRNHKIGKSAWNKGKKGVQVSWNKGLKFSKEYGERCTEKAHELLKKKCYIYNLTGEIVKEFIQIRDMISFLGVKNVTYYLNKYLIYKGKFILSTILLNKELIQLNAKTIKGGNFIRVSLINNKGVVEKFENITQAAKVCGVSTSSISNNIKGITKKTKLGTWIKD